MQLLINHLANPKIERESIDKMFKLIAANTLKIIKKLESRMVEVSFVSAPEITRINHHSRGINKVTDVISFSYDESVKNDFVLGEIYICWVQAVKQAKNYEHSLTREIAFLFTHGLLHLFGYNHIDEQEAKVMFALQEQILTKCKIGR